jgi:hypothetical protein
MMALRSLVTRSAVTVVAATALPFGALVAAGPAAATTSSTAVSAAGEASDRSPAPILCPLTTDQLLVWPGLIRCRPYPPLQDVRKTVIWQGPV